MMYRANLEEADISERTRRALKKAGYYSLYQLPMLPGALLKVTSKMRIGRKGFQEITQARRALK